MKQIRTRFAPSPTGLLHIGGVRTALFSWLYAKRHSGTFILRIEDTDYERSTDEATQVILDGMKWLGLQAEEGPFYQTHRMDRYHEVINELLNNGHAYHCYCSKDKLEAMRNTQLAAKQKPRYDGTCRDSIPNKSTVNPVVRFKNPQAGTVVVNDVIHGKVIFNNSELDDFIIMRSNGNPTYNFCVVVDDMDMEISHVIRGDDHLNNTPRQINLLNALNADIPTFAHVPMILGPDGAKLSKRHNAVSILQYKEEGYLPEALLNYLVRLGWSHGNQEVFTMEEMKQLFDIADVNKSASAFNAEKLLWLNQQHIMKATPERLAEHLQSQLVILGFQVDDMAKLAAIAKIQQQRAKTMKEMALNSIFFFSEFQNYDEKAAKKNLTTESVAPLSAVRDALQTLQQWAPTYIDIEINKVATQLQLKMGNIAQPLRVAVTGTAVSPPIDKVLAILGKEITLLRLNKAIKWITANIGVSHDNVIDI